MVDRTRLENRNNATSVLFALPAVALLIWDMVAKNSPARILLSCYVLTAVPFYVLSGTYPPLGSKWFWKSMIPIAAIAAFVVYLQVAISRWFAYIEVSLPARMAFGYTASFAVLEGWLALRIVAATEPKSEDNER